MAGSEEGSQAGRLLWRTLAPSTDRHSRSGGCARPSRRQVLPSVRHVDMTRPDAPRSLGVPALNLTIKYPVFIIDFVHLCEVGCCGGGIGTHTDQGVSNTKHNSLTSRASLIGLLVQRHTLVHSRTHLGISSSSWTFNLSVSGEPFQLKRSKQVSGIVPGIFPLQTTDLSVSGLAACSDETCDVAGLSVRNV